MAKSTRVNTEIAKKIRKPRPPVTGTLVGVRLQPPDLGRLDAWIAQQGEPGLGRPEAIRRVLDKALPPIEVVKARRSGKKES
jgi:hypothetical protein